MLRSDIRRRNKIFNYSADLSSQNVSVTGNSFFVIRVEKVSHYTLSHFINFNGQIVRITKKCKLFTGKLIYSNWLCYNIF
jgi:hypothetical protein